MTRRHDLSLIDDLVDNELSPERTAEVRQLIESSSEWRERYQETTKLINALRQNKISERPETHWVDSANRIIARTVARDGYSDRFVTVEEYRSGVSTVIRSMLSLAASIAILMASIYLGSQPQRFSDQSPNSRVILVAAPLAGSIEFTDAAFARVADRDRLTRASMMLGSPGLLGRMLELAELEESGR